MSATGAREGFLETADAGFLDPRFRRNVGRYVVQSALATVAVGLILCTFDLASQMALIAGLGASAFIAFTMPHTRAATPRCMIGGYVIGIAVGACCHEIATVPGVAAMLQQAKFIYPLFVAFAVGAAMFGMVITNTEHAPAASVTLGMMLNRWDYPTVGCVLFGVSLIVLIKGILQPFLTDLCAPSRPQPADPQTREGNEGLGLQARDARTVARLALADSMLRHMRARMQASR